MPADVCSALHWHARLALSWPLWRPDLRRLSSPGRSVPRRMLISLSRASNASNPNRHLGRVLQRSHSGRHRVQRHLQGHHLLVWLRKRSYLFVRQRNWNHTLRVQHSAQPVRNFRPPRAPSADHSGRGEGKCAPLSICACLFYPKLVRRDGGRARLGLVCDVSIGP
jgi:hypothetical protein